MKNIKKNLYLFTSNKCNENCHNCANAHLMKMKGQFSLLPLKSIKLDKYDTFFLTGGEPGLLKFEDKKSLIQELIKYNKRIEVLTNGTNIEDWDKISNNIYKSIHIIDLDKPLIQSSNSIYVIVINKLNYDRIQLDTNYTYYFINDQIEPVEDDIFNSICSKYKAKEINFNQDNTNIKCRRKKKGIRLEINDYIFINEIVFDRIPRLNTWVRLLV